MYVTLQLVACDGPGCEENLQSRILSHDELMKYDGIDWSVDDVCPCPVTGRTWPRHYCPTCTKKRRDNAERTTHDHA
jgi:hypothetical protein